MEDAMHRFEVVLCGRSKQQRRRGRNAEERSIDVHVLELFRTNPDAIGFMSARATMPAGVKTIKVKR
jgi:hypothetical protein